MPTRGLSAAIRGKAVTLETGVCRTDSGTGCLRQMPAFAARVPVQVYRRMDYPRHSLNRFLNARVGLFPNDGLAIDQQVYVWLFEAGSTPQFAMVYHAGHPVSRHSSLSISPDYVGVIRSAIREKWSDMPVLFLQGCGADLRPRIVGRRISRLPFFWLNKKFVAPPSSQQQAWIDDPTAPPSSP